MNRKLISKILSISLLLQLSSVSSLALENNVSESSSETTSPTKVSQVDTFLNGGKNLVRISGKDRVDTSILLSQFEFNDSRTVIIADGRNYPDALSASNLTSGTSPIFLINNHLTGSVIKEISRLNADKVIILGGVNSISKNVENKLSSIEGVKSVVRLSGVDRYDTSTKAFSFTDKKYALLASGENYPDALSSSYLIDSFGIMLTRKNNLPSSLKNNLENVDKEKAIIVGGTGSIGQSVSNVLKNQYSISNIQRISGVNRYDTSVKIAGTSNSDTVIIASGESFPDALTASTLSQKIKAPILLVNKNSISKYVKNYLSTNPVEKVIILGGKSSVSEKVENNLKSLIKIENANIADTNKENSSKVETPVNNSSKDNTDSHSAINPNSLKKDIFKPVPISADVKNRIWGKSYKPNNTIKIEDLCYIPVAYVDFNGNTAYGEIIVNKKVGNEVGNIFRDIYNSKIRIEKVRLIDEYGADDVRSMSDNNSSAFNYRVIKGTNRLSKHALGFAIDINPLYNPHVVRGVANPKIAQKYARRDRSNPYMIFKNDKLYNIFKKYGWHWGGEWTYPDYQHFEK